jgi:hypothetical protein
MTGRTFTARYRKSVLFVSLPVLAAAAVVAVAVWLALHNFTAALAAAGLALLSATMLVSAQKRARPALLLSEYGVEIDGLTILPWKMVGQVRVHESQSEDSDAPPGLVLRFAQRQGWPKDVRATGPSPLWRPLEGGLFLRAALLEDAPDTIADAFNFFLRQRGAAG